MKRSQHVIDLQHMLSHHYAESVRLKNSSEEFKKENLTLLDKEAAFFLKELSSPL